MVFFDFISFEYTCDYPEYAPEGFYGFPFVYRTNYGYGNSMAADAYWQGFIGNWAFWAVIWFMISRLIFSANNRVRRISTWMIGIWAVLITLWAAMTLDAMEHRWQWSHDDFSIGYFKKPVKCERKITFFQK